ncbi:hypothetical protein A8144_05180 [Mycobacterium leprae 3125609]|nr:hypothetical protein A8144_05180 [Mycobacterium leprae 3125609]OAX71800.1 hypothetical protein A3216_03900 [Mycobacterium leprae 7935681]
MSLIQDLVDRCPMVMAGDALPQANPTALHNVALSADHGVHVEIRLGNGAQHVQHRDGRLGCAGIGVESWR